MQETSSIISTIRLNELINVVLCDETRHYFGGYYHVKVLAFCDMPFSENYFNCGAEFLDARSRMGESVRFKRVLEKMAVPQDEIESVRNRLITAFNETTLAYLAAPDFAKLFVRSAYLKKIGQPVRQQPAGV